jgi:hypothetical protein
MIWVLSCNVTVVCVLCIESPDGEPVGGIKDGGGRHAHFLLSFVFVMPVAVRQLAACLFLALVAEVVGNGLALLAQSRYRSSSPLTTLAMLLARPPGMQSPAHRACLRGWCSGLTLLIWCVSQLLLPRAACRCIFSYYLRHRDSAKL